MVAVVGGSGRRGWMDWLAGWLVMLWLWTISSGRLGQVPWANGLAAKVTVGSLLLGCWCNENDEGNSTRPATGNGSAWLAPFRSDDSFAEGLIQEMVGSMLGGSQEYPESYEAGPQERQDVDVDVDGLRVAWCCVEKATGT